MRNRAITLALLAAASHANADDAGAIDSAAKTLGSPSASGQLSADHGLQIAAESGSSNVTLKGTFDRSSQAFGYNTFSIVAKAPINADSSKKSLLTQDGLADGTVVEARYTTLRLHGANSQDDLAAQMCERLFAELKEKAKDLECDLGAFSSLLEQKLITAAEYQQFQSYFYREDAHIWSAGVSAAAGYQELTFFDPATLLETEQRKKGWSIGLFGGYMPVNGRMAFNASFKFEATYKNADASTACLPAPSASGGLVCANGPIGLPTETKSPVLNLEWRRKLSARAAFSVGVKRNFKTDVTTLSVPVYFIPDKKQNLTSGLVLGWASDDHKVRLGLFVGQGFSLTK